MSVKLFDSPNKIPGISTYAEGAQLSFAGYKDISAIEYKNDENSY